MHSLFWKILVSFWLSLILFAGLTLWTTSHYLESIRNETSLAHPRVNINKFIDEAQKITATQGIDGLRKWIIELDKREAIPYLLIDQHGNDLINRPVPLRLQERIKKHERRYIHNESKLDKEPRRAHRRPISVNDMRYRLLPDFHAVTLNRVLTRPRVMAIPLLLATLISGIVCFLLARYLTSPIKKLRLATRKLATGDLDVRVVPAMGSRKDEMVELAHDFDKMAEQLQNLMSSQKQLLSDASHELRSPLARLQVALGLARQRNPQDSSHELDRIERESERLNELIGQLLSLARLDSGLTDIKQDTINLEGLLEDIAEDAAYEARAKSRDVAIKSSVPASIQGNRVLLHSALENIIRNAIRYTKENTTVELLMQYDPDKKGWVIIQVRDHGPGIPEDMLERIFEPFVRVGEARDRESGGYGLGLAIASRAIKLHRGNIKACNETYNGTIIQINLPVNQVMPAG